MKRAVFAIILVLVVGGCWLGFSRLTASGKSLESLAVPVLTLSGETVFWAAVPNAKEYIVMQNGAKAYEGASTSYKIPMCNTQEINISVEAVAAKERYLSSISDTLALNRLPIYTSIGIEPIEIEGVGIDFLVWPALEGASAYIVTLTRGEEQETITYTNDQADGGGLFMIEVDDKLTAATIIAQTNAKNTLPGSTGIIDLTISDSECIAAPGNVTVRGLVKVMWDAVGEARSYTIYKDGEAATTTTATEYLQTATLEQDTQIGIVANPLRKRLASGMSKIVTLVAFDEFDLYNYTYNNARNYGALEMFSNGFSDAGGGTNVYARGHKIQNFIDAAPQDFYVMTSARGTGLGANAATQIREVYYRDEAFNIRGRAGSLLSGSGMIVDNSTEKVVPIFSGDKQISSTLKSTYISKTSDPFRYILYNFTQAGVESTTLTFDGATRQFVLTAKFTLGSGNDWGEGVKNNVPDIDFSGNVTTKKYEICNVTFYINTDMQFVKYLATDKYVVGSIIGDQTTTTTAHMFFVYHESNININGYEISRPRTDWDTSKEFITNSLYKIDLGWTA